MTMTTTLQDDLRLEREFSGGPAATWLPYTLIDQVLAAAGEGRTARRQALRSELQTEIASRLKLLQKFDK